MICLHRYLGSVAIRSSLERHSSCVATGDGFSLQFRIGVDKRVARVRLTLGASGKVQVNRLGVSCKSIGASSPRKSMGMGALYKSMGPVSLHKFWSIRHLRSLARQSKSPILGARSVSPALQLSRPQSLPIALLEDVSLPLSPLFPRLELCTR